MKDLIELSKYLPFLTERDKGFHKGLFYFENYESLEEYYDSLVMNWKIVLSVKLPPVYQAIISYVLMIYFQFQKLEELHEKFPTLEVVSSYLMILIRQSQKEKIKGILNSFPITRIDKSLLVSKIDFLIWQTYFFIYERDFQKAKEILQYIENILEEIKSNKKYNLVYRQEKALFFNVEGILHQIERDHHKSLVSSKKGIDILEKEGIEDSFILGTLYNSFGSALNILGDPEAKEGFSKGLEHFSRNNIERGIAVCQANIATLLIQEGRFDQAIKYFYNFIDIMSKFQDQRNILVIYNHIYSCLRSMEKMDEAEEYLIKAFDSMKKYNIENDDIYLDATEFYAINGNFDLAESYLKKYYEIMKVKEEEETLNKSTWHISKGLIELKKMNVFASEQELIEGIKLARKNNFAPLVLQGLIYLIELLIIKYRATDGVDLKNNLIEELELNCQECVILLREYKSIFQMVNYNLLLATVYILSFKYELAQDVLNRTMKVCIDYNLQKQLDRAERSLRIAIELKERSKQEDIEQEIHQMRTEFEISMTDYSERGVKEATYIASTEEKPILLFLLVILPSGLPVYSYNFKSERISDDELLIAGLINAIQNFSTEISMKKGEFRMLEHTDYLVLLEPRESFTIALFTDSFSYEIKEGILKFADETEKSIEILEKKDFVKSDEIRQITMKLDKSVNELFPETK